MAKRPLDACSAAVQAAAGRELTESELETIFEETQGRIRRYEAEGMSRFDAGMRAGREYAESMRLAGLIEKRSRLINERVNNQLTMRVLRGEAEALHLRDYLTGGEGRQGEQALSLSAVSKARSEVVAADFARALEDAGVFPALKARNKDMDRAIAQELWAVGDKRPSVTGNKIARTAAEIIYEHQDRVRQMQNAAGAWIAENKHYIARQTHDSTKLRRSTFEAWRDFIAPRLDERTFDRLGDASPAAREAFLKAAYQDLRDGLHLTSKADGEVIGAFTGPANLAKRLSHSRTLVFKDADAWMDYNAQYGQRSLMDAVVSGLDSGARNAAIMEMLGTNPEAMLKNIKERALTRAQDRGDEKTLNQLQNRLNNDAILAMITGRASAPESMRIGNVTNGMLALNSMSKLGGVVLSSLTDPFSVAAMMRHNGIGLFESTLHQFTSLLPRGAGRKQVADMVRVGGEAVLGQVADRYHSADGLTGGMARAVNVFHKLNGLEFWTSRMREGAASMLSYNLGRNAAKEYDQLPRLLRGTLERYGIDGKAWDAARQTMQRVNGDPYIFAADIPNANIRNRFQTYISDQVAEGMSEPTAYSRTIATLGTQAGTIEGMAMRMFMQFKSFPISFMTRTLNREINRVGMNGLERIPSFILMAGTMTMAGYVAMELKNLARGRNTRSSEAKDPSDWAKIAFAAMAQGGGAGLLGDFLFGEVSRTGGGPLTAMLGPSVQTADDVLKLIPLARDAVFGGTRQSAQAVRELTSTGIGLARDNTPFLNLFYTRAMVDYYLWHSLQEWSNPGYLSRFENRVRQDQRQTFWLHPTGGMEMPR